ncbi:MAG: hypothetical protein NC177_01530 [Ruminococcus flavefaciens]|nr:hypothetical protein [Ruminococcus flavefaciens]
MTDEKRTENNQQPNENERKKLTASKWFKPLAVSVPVLIAGIIISSPFIKDYKEPSPTDISISEEDGGEGLQKDPNAGEYVEPVKQETENSGVSVPGWSSLNIPAETSEVTTVDFFNPEENAEKYSLTFELRIPEEDGEGYEVLYTSGLVDPGLHIQKINLSRGLEAGVYDAIIHVQPYRMDENNTATNNADLQTKLIVS